MFGEIGLSVLVMSIKLCVCVKCVIYCEWTVWVSCKQVRWILCFVMNRAREEIKFEKPLMLGEESFKDILSKGN